jgi:hypothetical protein
MISSTAIEMPGKESPSQAVFCNRAPNSCIPTITARVVACEDAVVARYLGTSSRGRVLELLVREV